MLSSIKNKSNFKLPGFMYNQHCPTCPWNFCTQRKTKGHRLLQHPAWPSHHTHLPAVALTSTANELQRYFLLLPVEYTSSQNSHQSVPRHKSIPPTSLQESHRKEPGRGPPNEGTALSTKSINAQHFWNITRSLEFREIVVTRKSQQI